MEPLNLSIPKQHEYSDPTVERDENRLHDWLTNLPLMDVVETVRLVLGALKAMNEQKLEPESRFRYLEIYRITGHHLLVTVDPLNLRQLALTRAQREEATGGVEQLLLNIAAGYKLIVMTLHSQTADHNMPALFGHAINRAIELMGLALLESYRFYRTVEPYIIAELNQLYRAARYHGLLGVSVDAGENHDDEEAAPVATIAELYHAILLLSLTDPSRLAEGEVGLLADVLVQYAGRCRIVPGHQLPPDPEGMFWLDLYGDSIPVSCTRTEMATGIREPYLLDARVTLQAVREQLARTPAKVRMQSPEAMVLRRLLPEQVGEAGRREDRQAGSRWVNLLLGLEQIHGYLMKTSRRNSQSVPDDMKDVPEPVECQLLDSSESGMRLVWNEAADGDVRVGDLLGVVGDGSRLNRLQLAIIRSVRVYREGGIELGVELIRGGVGPVVCSLPDVPERAAESVLFMPADEEAEVGATLVASKGLYEEKCKLEIDVAGKQVRARAARCVFDSSVFDRFEYTAEQADT